MVNVSWLWESWLVLLPPPWCGVVLTLASIVGGLLLGTKTGSLGKAIPSNTLSLICVGSAVFTMLSFAFTGKPDDSGCVAAQIVIASGVLGTAVLLRSRSVSNGLLAAALLWIAATIGMVVDAGYVIAGLGLSILVKGLLWAINFYENHRRADLCRVRVIIEYLLTGGITEIRLQRQLLDYNLVGSSESWSQISNEAGCLTLNVSLTRLRLDELVSDLADVPDVCSIEQRARP